MQGFLHFSNSYFLWHYTRSLGSFARIFRDILWFLYHFFSIPTLIRTLFVPFHRLSEEYPQGFHPQEWAQVAFINLVSRLIGFVLRMIVIVLGAVFITSFVLLGAVAFIVWLLLPALVLGLLLASANLLI